jgi:non-ribosomal peptide synthetase component E (peptide arylation enzyme)
MVMEHAKKIASYKRPQHVEIWPAGKDFPITRSTKVDKLALKEAAKIIIEDLRRQGKWDAV